MQSTASSNTLPEPPFLFKSKPPRYRGTPVVLCRTSDLDTIEAQIIERKIDKPFDRARNNAFALFFPVDPVPDLGRSYVEIEIHKAR